jgi:hypothetical protein
MSTAVFITGHMRTFATCAHSLKWSVLRHYAWDELEFFISTVNDEQAESWKLIDKLFPGAPVRVRVEPSQPELPEPVEFVRFEPYARSVSVQAVLRQLWQLNQAWLHYSERVEPPHDVFIRTRPDLFWHSFKQPHQPDVNEAYVPWWGRFGGVNDRFAVMGSYAASHYFRTYQKIETLMKSGCPLHPESLIAASLWDGDCIIRDTLKAEFSTLRLDGTARGPEITPIDMAHAQM